MTIRHLLLLMAALMVSGTGLSASDLNGKETLKRYMELITTGNHEVAMDLWEPSAVERSARFPITYTDARMKIDCSTPIDPEVMITAALMPAKSVEPLAGDQAFRLGFSGGMGDGVSRSSYVVRKSGDYFYLTYAQDVIAADWPVDSSSYFRIHAHPSVRGKLNPVSLEDADLFVERMIDSLGLGAAERELLRKGKIEFFYCDSDSTMKKISGVPVKGIFDLASNDIISSVFPHHHEVVHLLVNLKLRTLPMYTIPLLREGLAVQFGGRWSKMPSALGELGAFLYKERLVELDSLLTYKSFGISGSDIAYPVAGAFCQFLLGRLGREGFFSLYRDVSGPYDSLYRLDHEDVRAILLRHTKLMNWTDLMAQFDEFIAAEASSPRFARPGPGEKTKQVVSAKNWTVSEEKGWLEFRFTASPSDSLRGSYLCVRDGRLAAAGTKTTDESAGFRYAIRVDQNEAGLYDLATSYLLAKYIWGITPSESYFDRSSRTITIRFNADLFGHYADRISEFKTLSL